MSQTLNIGLLGFGVVGQGFYEIFSQNRPVGFAIQRIAAKNPGKERLSLDAVIEFEALSIIEDPNIHIIVEAINDAPSAYQLVKRALANGKHAVTANKQMLAKHLPELLKIAHHQGVSLLFEGAVGGVIPILQNLRNYLSHDRIEYIEGIINGSSNYILTQLSESDKSYEQAVKDAQAKGFAELNPTEDVGGFDAAAKLSIIASLGFNTHLPTHQIATLGIENIGAQDFEFAKHLGLSIKQIARIDATEAQLSAYVLPSFVAANHPLFHIKNEFNALRVVGKHSGEHLLSGKGAGKLPTGFAVYNDLLQVGKPHPAAASTEQQVSEQDPVITVYLRTNDGIPAIDAFGFELVDELGPDTFLAEIPLTQLRTFGQSPNSTSTLVIEAGVLSAKNIAHRLDLTTSQKF